MKLLYLYRGHNSGTNAAVLQALQRLLPAGQLVTRDLDRSAPRGKTPILLELPTALRRGGAAALWPGRGRWHDAVKRSHAYMRRLAYQVVGACCAESFDAVLMMGSAWPIEGVGCPCYIYTDMVILANAEFADGSTYIELWKEVLPWERHTLANARRIFTMSAYISRYCREAYDLPAEHVVRVNAGCNIPAPTGEVTHRAGKDVLFLGVDWQRKGGPDAFEAFLRVRRRHPEATFTVAGARPAIDAPGVRVLGRVAPRRVASLLDRAAVMCLPSHHEPFGIAYLEAMRAGVPVIAADQGATPDFVASGRTGFRVAPGDVDALEARLDLLLSDPDLRRRMGRAGREQVMQEYTWERTCQRMLACIEADISDASRRREVLVR